MVNGLRRNLKERKEKGFTTEIAEGNGGNGELGGTGKPSGRRERIIRARGRSTESQKERK